jgi:hypothetical protein
VEGRKKKIQKKWEQPDRSRLSGCPNFFEIFLFLKNEFLEVWEMG